MYCKSAPKKTGTDVASTPFHAEPAFRDVYDPSLAVVLA